MVTRREYDANSNLSTVIAENTTGDQETRYTYDVLNRQTMVEDPVSSITETFYDLNSNVTKTVGADNYSTTYEFDAANRNIETTFPLNSPNLKEESQK